MAFCALATLRYDFHRGVAKMPRSTRSIPFCNMGYCMRYDWKHKTIVITGGSSGLGLAIAQAFAERGARLVLIARDEARLQRAAEAVGRGGVRVSTWTADLTSSEEVARAFTAIRQEQATFDVLVNAAGRSDRSAILDTGEQDFQALWDLNFLGVVRCTRWAAESLMPVRGHVVNIGSLASKTASRYLGAYPASKFAVAAYSQQLRLELGPRGLHVLLVCPGPLARDDAGQRYAERRRPDCPSRRVARAAVPDCV